jgi:hypothetical protein
MIPTQNEAKKKPHGFNEFFVSQIKSADEGNPGWFHLDSLASVAQHDHRRSPPSQASLWLQPRQVSYGEAQPTLNGGVAYARCRAYARARLRSADKSASPPAM